MTKGRKTTRAEVAKPVNLGRHESQCSVCKHTQIEDIEHDFVNWGSTSEMAKKYGISRDSIYRHAHARDLMGKRGRNLHAALQHIIEKAGQVEVTAIRNPQNNDNYNGLSYDDQRRQFVRDANGDYQFATPVEVTVQDLLGGKGGQPGSSAGGETPTWVTPDAAAAYIAERRARR